MINAEKLLGGLLKNTMGTNKLGARLGGRSAIGLGVLGMVMAAAEHYKEHGSLWENAPDKGANTNQPSAAPPPPPPGQAQATPPPPPPPPGAAGAGPGAHQPREQETAVLLLRAMIAAAYADGVLDADERKRIFGRLQDFGMNKEEQDFLQRELQTPHTAEEIAAASSPEVAAQVYGASLLAVEVDTPEEQAYLERLQHLLGLDDAAVLDVKRELGVV